MRNTILSRRPFLATVMASTVLLVTMLAVACAGSAPPPAPTAAPKPAAAPTTAPKPAAPTQAPAAPAATKAPAAAPTKAPTAAPAPKVSYPEKGKTIMFSVGYVAGGSTDIAMRLLGSVLEKDLGVGVEVVNKPGAATQVMLSDLLKSKPDGYTAAQVVLPTSSTTYLDPKRKATYSRKDFQPVASWVVMPNALAVGVDSPYKSLKDLVDAAKAEPKKIKVADAGIGTSANLAVLMLEQQTGIKFATVHFEGSPQGLAALMGGHVDAQAGNAASFIAPRKAGQVRVLGVSVKERDKLMSDIPTFVEQGYQVNVASYYGLVVPAGTPKEIVDVLDRAVKRAMENEELRTKLESGGQTPMYLSSQQFNAEWDYTDGYVKELLAIAE